MNNKEFKKAMAEAFLRIETKKYGIPVYKRNQDGTIDVYGDVDLSGRILQDMPIRFNRVYGNFDCSKNNLTSLRNGPKVVHGNFSCQDNELTSLEHFPITVYGVIKVN